MKKNILILCCLIPYSLCAAQELPKWVNKARKAVFSVITYDKNDKILNTGNGFYIDETGTAVSDYSLFEGAERAIIVTTEGKELPVKYIMGASDIYDVVKFKAETDKKQEYLVPAPQPAAVGETVYLLPYSTQKSVSGQSGKITKVDSISNDSFYYTLDMQTTDKTVSCPLMNANGEVLGLIQKNVSDDSKESFAIGIGYAQSLSIGALSGNDFTLNSIGIRKGLPENESEALVYLYMISSKLDREEYISLLNEFIAMYPKNPEGYVRRATAQATFNDDEHYQLAEEDLENMLKIAEPKEEVHSSIAKFLYNYLLGIGAQEPYKEWTYERAIDEINAAIQISPAPIYYQTMGNIYFAMQKYPEALAAYDFVNRSSLASANSFYSAARTRERMGSEDKTEIIALMDSAIAKFNPPYGREAAPYICERARIKSEAGQHREAVFDYNLYSEAMLGQVSAEFYITREIEEMQCKMYQQALDDINKAVEMEPNNSDYWMEKGSVHLRINQPDEAIKALEKAISLNDKNAAAYRMLGYCQISQKKEAEGMTNLQKAKELGDTVADELLQEYQKK